MACISRVACPPGGEGLVDRIVWRSADYEDQDTKAHDNEDDDSVHFKPHHCSNRRDRGSEQCTLDQEAAHPGVPFIQVVRLLFFSRASPGAGSRSAGAAVMLDLVHALGSGRRAGFGTKGLTGFLACRTPRPPLRGSQCGEATPRCHNPIPLVRRPALASQTTRPAQPEPRTGSEAPRESASELDHWRLKSGSP